VPRFLRFFPAIAMLTMMPLAHAAESESAGETPLRMEPFRIPVVDGGRVVARLDLIVALAPDPKSHAPIVEPVLRAAIFAACVEFARLNVSSGLPVNVVALSRSIDEAVRDAGGGGVRPLILEVRTRAIAS
tara:strand:- start:122 stop:514 length:393 start_codon:yes stop_codon:yes gene_type:complete